MLPVVEIVSNNAIHAYLVFTTFYVNGLTHPRISLALPLRGSGLGLGEMSDRFTNIGPKCSQAGQRVYHKMNESLTTYA